MERTNPYQDLSQELTEQRLAAVTEQYWNAVDLVAALMADRANLLNHLKDIHTDTR